MSAIRTIGTLLALACGACSETTATGASGELGREQFFYVCVTSADVQCINADGAVPGRVAVGGHFRLDTTPNGGGSSQIEPASSQLVNDLGGDFEFLRPGVSAFLAFDGSGELADFSHLVAVVADGVRVFGEQDQVLHTLLMTSGESLLVRGIPLRGAEELAGSMRYTWSSADSEVLQVPGRLGSSVEISALTPGTTTLRVGTSEFTEQVEVRVQARPSSMPSSTAPDDDAGPDSGPVADAQPPPADASIADATVSDAQTAPTTPVDASDVHADSMVLDAGATDGSAAASDASPNPDADAQLSDGGAT